jgi:hypothetical protein
MEPLTTVSCASVDCSGPEWDYPALCAIRFDEAPNLLQSAGRFEGRPNAVEPVPIFRHFDL